MRPLKSREQLVAEGYNAEGALVFLNEFFAEEKGKLLNLMLTCPPEDLQSRRAVYKYLCSIESTLTNKVLTGIKHATEQSDE